MADLKSRVSYDVASEDMSCEIKITMTAINIPKRPVGGLLLEKENIAASSGYLCDTGGT